LIISIHVTRICTKALFEKIADRDAMAIRADKLFRIILNTGRNEFTIERYRRVLNVKQKKNGKIQGKNGLFRVVSRGPFLAMFKHESISFVNSLENAARLSTGKKKRKNKNDSVGVSDRSKECGGKEDVLSTRQTIVSAPVASSAFDKSSSNENVMKPKSLKRKKTEDKTGMIIETDKDDCCDEISAVSVSPVNADEIKPASGKNDTYNMMDSIQKSPLKERTLIKSESVQGILSSTKRSSSTKTKKTKKSKQRSSTKKQKSRPRARYGDHKINEDTESCHSRCNSSLESIKNIREVMCANESPRENKRLKIDDRTSSFVTPSSKSVSINEGPPVHPLYGMPTGMYNPHPYAAYPMLHPVPYGHLHHVHMTSQAVGIYHQEEEELLCDNGKNDCSIFGSLASLFKRLLGNPRKENDFTEHNDGFKFEAGHFNPHIVYPCYDNRGFDPRFHSDYNQEAYPRFTTGTNVDDHFSKPLSQEYDEEKTFMSSVDHDEDSRKSARLYHHPLKDNNEYYGNLNANPATNEHYSVPQAEATYQHHNHFLSSGKIEKSSSSRDASDQLKIYEFKPRIDLPEPGCLQYDLKDTCNLSKPLIYDCTSDNGNLYDKTARNLAQTSQDKPITQPRKSNNFGHSANSSAKEDKIQPHLKRNQHERQKRKSLNSAKDTSEDECINPEPKARKPHFLDSNECKVDRNAVGDEECSTAKVKEEPKRTRKKKMKKQCQNDSSTCDKNGRMTLLNGQRPKLTKGSRSRSDGRISKGTRSHSDTLSLTRGSSIGSALSSLTSSSDLFPGSNQQKNNGRYYHYR
jgi:hypothetical protein